MKQLILILVALMLTGCLSVAVKPDQVAKTNRFFEGETLNGNSARTAHVEGFTFADERLDTSFGKLHVVIAQSDARRPLIVFCGGNAFREDLGGAKRMEALAPFGDVLFFDYPGLGSSDGSGVAADYRATETAVLARTETLAAERGASSVIFWGHSLGGGVCSSLAAHSKLASTLVVEGAFANIRDVGRSIAGVAAPIVRFNVPAETVDYDIPSLLTDYRGPIVVVASHADETIPYGLTHGLYRRLAKTHAKVRFVELQDAKHSTLFTDPAYRGGLEKALAE